MPNPNPTTPPSDPTALIQLYAARANENIANLTPRIQLSGDEREAFALTEGVCGDIAAGRRA